MPTKVRFVHRHKEYKRDDEVTVSDSQAKEWKEQGLIEIIEKGDFPETGQEKVTPLHQLPDSIKNLKSSFNLEPGITGNDIRLAINRLSGKAGKPTTKKATKKK
jgi:hypothetical protein